MRGGHDNNLRAMPLDCTLGNAIRWRGDAVARWAGTTKVSR
jgi:hypothetical protein